MFYGTLKALMIQSLFLWTLAANAQSVFIEKPRPGAALADTQDFVVVAGGTPQRVDFYLNGRLILARQERPFNFSVSWDTRFRNVVRVVAHYADGTSAEAEQVYQEIVADIREEVEVFQFFPFLERPLDSSRWKLIHKGQQIQPQVFEKADKFTLHLVIALDTSGSMMYSIEDVADPLRDLMKWCFDEGFSVKFLVFDRSPRLIRIEDLPADLKQLYQGQGKSVIWDTIATASELFPRGPRRLLLLVSDGADDGSIHGVDSAAVYLKKSNAALVWVNPTKLKVKQLAQLATVSGGFVVDARARNSWDSLSFLIQNQYHLLAPQASWPIDFKPSRGRAWYPRWPD